MGSNLQAKGAECPELKIHSTSLGAAQCFPRSRLLPWERPRASRDPGRFPGNGLELPKIQGTSLGMA